MKIYLAGGMKSDWQDKVIDSAPSNTYFDPRSHGLSIPNEYTEWDLRHIKESDLVFACFTKDNPSGFGMCIEIGFAHRARTPIILVDEQQLRSWDIVRCCCKNVFDNLQGGLLLLRDLTYGKVLV